MSNKKTILHIINNFGRGGAETMLVSVLKELKEYNNIVVTLYEENRFDDDLKFDKYYCLKLKSVFFLPFTIVKLRSIIKANAVDLVHSHLYWPTFAARFATPKRVSLITTIHTSVAYTKDYKKPVIRFLDRFSYNSRKSTIIAVAKGAMQQYFDLLKIKPFKTHVLYTFVDTAVFNNAESKRVDEGAVCKVMTIGTLRYPKNHQYLVSVFEKLKDAPIELHIYGNGPMQAELQEAIDRTGARVILKGEVNNVQDVFPQYDLYIMASLFEGFSLSVLEAMAMQMPLLLSDIPSFREQCAETAVYFDLQDIDDCVQKIKGLSADKILLEKMGQLAKERAVHNFTLAHHMTGLRAIYTETLNQQA
jgi:glycosyltransferase involved in cell wall biosynthesis